MMPVITNPIKPRAMTRWQKSLGEIRKDYLLYVMIIPGLFYFLIFHYWPMYGISIAFRNFSIFKGFADAPWVGFKHYISLFSKPGFINALQNNIIISIQKLLIGFPIPIILSLLINEVENRPFRKFVQTSVIVPNFISWIVVSGLLFAIFSPNTGAIKGLLSFVGYQGVIPNLMANKDYFRITILISYIWKGAGMGTIVYLAAITSIDPNLYEAAAIDGAGKFQQTWHITLASIRSTIVIMLLFRVGQIMDAGFDQIFAITNDLVNPVAEIIDTYVYKLGIVQRNYSIATAAGVFKSVIGLVLVVSANALSKKIDEDSGII